MDPRSQLVRYRVTTLLLAMTITAIAVASRPWLAGHDLIVGVVLFSMWMAIGFLFGWSASRWESRPTRLATVACVAIIAHGTLWYCWRLAIGFLNSSENLIYSRASVLAWLVRVDDWHVFELVTGASILVCIIAALRHQERLLAATVVASLLFWFTTYWAAFLWTAASTAPPD
jgi:hypothetical protein